jgi:uncharacterized membrane protein
MKTTSTTRTAGEIGGARPGRSPGEPDTTSTAPRACAVPVMPGLLLGIGLGGFIDGIVLHQILQWHHLLTNTDRYPADTIAGLEANTLADGLFHAATWIFVFVGTWLAIKAWKDGRLAPPWRTHIGLLLAGWGSFNLVEGVVDHHVLRVHHVRDDVPEPLPWDLGFLAFGVLLVAMGLLLVHSGRQVAAGRAASATEPKLTSSPSGATEGP